MRDEKRIPNILHELGRIWEAYPDLRLGQLLLNAVGHNETALFYIEDEELISKLYHDIYKNAMENIKNGKKG